MTSIKKLSAAGVALTLGAGALAAATMTPAYAATGTTATVNGQTFNQVAQLWYNASAQPKPASNPGPNRNVTLTAVANGADIDVSIALSQGPQNSFTPLAAASAATGNKYALDALVRLDGATNGDYTHRLAGQAGADAVASNAVVHPSGVTITGTIPRAGVGTHKVTLTHVVLNITGESSGLSLEDPYAGFDTFYNTNVNSATANGDWPVSETVSISEAAPKDTVKPAVTVKKLKKKKAKKGNAWTTIEGTISDALSGPDRVEVSLVSKVKIPKNASKKVKKKKFAFFNGKKYKTVKTKKLANKRAAKKAVVAIPGLNGKWTAAPGVKAPKGKLTVKATGYDKDGNKRTVTVKQKITK